MIGIIENYLVEKKYGFIIGEDNEKYFFHFNELENKELSKGLLVSFEPGLNKKGFFAKNIKIDNLKNIKYEIPEQLKAYKDNSYMKEYEILENNKFKLHMESRDMNAAYNNLLLFSKYMGANALIELKYFKSTDSEAGTGYGTYYYTVHHYTAVPILIGKKSLKGTKEIPKPRIEEMCNILRLKTIESTKKSKYKFYILLILILIVNVGYFKIPFLEAYLKQIPYLFIIIGSFILLYINKIKYTDDTVLYR